MAITYEQFTREDFESWLDTVTTGQKWRQKPGTAGVYQVLLSETVAVEVSSSLTGRDDVVSRAEASMSVKLVSLVTGFTLNKIAQGQTHFKRTKGWRVNLAKGLERMVSTYRASSSFYDVLAGIKDREAYKRDNLAKIQAVPNWQQNDFLASLHERLSKDGVLTVKQLESLDRATSRPVSAPPTPPPAAPAVNPELLGQVRALYAIGKERNNAWLMDFTKSVAEIIKAGRPGSDAQRRTLNGLLDEYEDAIQAILRRSPNLVRSAAERVADAHEVRQRWALLRSDPVEYERRHGKYAPPGVYT